MNSLAMNYLQTVETLPPSSTLIIEAVSWETYQNLLQQIQDDSNVRLSYDQGVLEIMTLSPRHEKWKGLFAHLLAVIVEALDLNLISLGSTTFSLPAMAQGVEPDDCFYIRHAAVMAKKDEVNLAVDPAPELVVEIDISHRSLYKMPIYANLGVAEIWRHDGTQVKFYHLLGKSYVEVESSDLFPFVTSAILSQFLETGKEQGVIPMVRAFREWVQTRLDG